MQTEQGRYAMSWEEQLITLYLRLCKEYQLNLWSECERFTNGGCKAFTDEEAMLIYIWGTLKGLKSICSIHRYFSEHLSDWFPSLPKYSSFVHRINRLHAAFQMLCGQLQSEKVSGEDEDVYLIDSFPITLAQNNHAYTAKVAPELASKSYNSTKKMYYYGVKAHVVARKREGTLPDIEIFMVEEAARQDGPVFDQIRPFLHDNLAFADQAYKRPDAQKIEEEQQLKVLTPIKKNKGQKVLEPEQKTFSKEVSRMRQPIETLFGWIHKKTNIENAGLVRSSAGLLTHIFGKLATALLIRNYA